MNTKIVSRAVWTLCLCASAPLCLPATAGEAAFSAKPAATKDGDKVKVAFTLAAPTDVEVAVLGADGKVVRHLAAGVLGAKNPPPAPLKAGLAQELVWDGKNDFGKPAAGGPWKVRVRAGTGVKFGRFVGDSPYLDNVTSMVSDEEGNLYMQCGGHVRVFDSEGRYLRELLPFAASVPGDSVPGIATWDEEAKAFHPTNRYTLFPRIYPMGATLSHASLKTGVLFADARKLYRIDAMDGRVIGSSLDSHDLWGGAKHPGFPESSKSTGGVAVWVALSPDGKYAYLSGPFSSKSPDVPPGRVYRLSMDGKDTWKEFVTVKVAGHYLKHMGYWDEYWGPRSPVQGVAVDAKGQVYVCDRENGRVAVFSEDAREVGAVKVEYPEQVAVHPKTGAIYVLQRDRTAYANAHVVLFKFDKLGENVQPSAQFKFTPKIRRPQMVLAAGKDRTLVWMTGVPEGVTVLEDKGGAFEPVQTAYQPPEHLPQGFARISVDPEREDVYIQDGGNMAYRWNGLSGEGGVLKKDGKVFYATDLTVGYDGLIYCQKANGTKPFGQEYSGPLHRYTRDLAPAPYASGSHVLTPYIYARYGHGLNCEKGMALSPDGRLYISMMYNWAKYAVIGFAADGKPLKGSYMQGRFGEPVYRAGLDKEIDSAVIGPIPGQNGGLRVDLAGNIYLGVRARPKDHEAPAAFAKDRAYDWVGSVVRFGPEGGVVLGVAEAKSEKPDAPRIELTNKLTAENATMVYDGIAPFSGPGYGSPSTCCVCRIPRFDVDRYGRVCMPNAVTTSARIVDNNNNLILEFGKYGNFDSQYVNPVAPAGKDKKPTVDTPEIPMAWPTGVGVSDGHVYVVDTYNERVVRADFTWKAEESCDIK